METFSISITVGQLSIMIQFSKAIIFHSELAWGVIFFL